MSSSAQLWVGTKLGKAQIKAQWLKLNNNSGHQVHVSQNTKKPKARYFSVCITAERQCDAHVKAIGDNEENMEITSIQTTHNCQSDNSKRRKQNYSTRDIAEISNVLSIYEPTCKREGNAKQFVTMTKTATGMDIKSGQASLVVRTKSHDTIEAQLGQYLWLPSLFNALNTEDPSGNPLR